MKMNNNLNWICQLKLTCAALSIIPDWKKKREEWWCGESFSLRLPQASDQSTAEATLCPGATEHGEIKWEPHSSCSDDLDTPALRDASADNGILLQTVFNEVWDGGWVKLKSGNTKTLKDKKL